jgi:Methyltransferase domain
MDASAVKAHSKKSASVFEQLGLREGQNLDLLKALHILTPQGQINQDSRRKLKQVRHLLQLIAPLMEKLRACQEAVTLVDHGAGKSYLGFMLYDLFYAGRRNAGQVIGVEVRDDLVMRSRQLAAQFGFSEMQFFNLSVAASSSVLPQKVDIVTALHACDTATDDAIAFALAHQAQHLVLVPCCQAEVAARLRLHKSRSLQNNPLAELWRRPLHTREFGSQLTNVLRCLQLEAHGYEVTATELVGWEHSMKNELIIASKIVPTQGVRRAHSSARKLQTLLAQVGLLGMHSRFFTPLVSPPDADAQ